MTKTCSVEGHKRYWTRKKLAKLVGEEITLYNETNGDEGYTDPIDSGILEKREGKDAGYYINGKKINVRSVEDICEMDIRCKRLSINFAYLQDFRNYKLIMEALA
jgi:hypothetical protein